jgi:hypothetical protein
MLPVVEDPDALVVPEEFEPLVRDPPLSPLPPALQNELPIAMKPRMAAPE